MSSQFAEQLIWAPIRHHSPQCSRQLTLLLEQTQPDIVLIEGPSEANSLLPFLQDKTAKAPLAIYIYAIDKRRRWTDSNEVCRYRCYVPFAEMSPEWNALRIAGKKNIPVEFIDLPYVRQLDVDEQRKEHVQSREYLRYNEKAFLGGDPIQCLLKNDDCRHFDEWWDRNIETGVSYSKPSCFFENLTEFCSLLRRAATEIDAQTRARETYMAENIRRHLEAGKRCFIVCGGFHYEGIKHYLEHPSTFGEQDIDVESNVHLVPYSLSRLNIANGYAAGMPDCGYYDQLWQSLLSLQEECSIQQMHVRLTTEVIEKLREKHYFITTPDVVEANVLCSRLAELRGIRAGRLELRDAVNTAFVKQSISDDHYFAELLSQVLAGSSVGVLPGGIPLAPLVHNFRELCDSFKLPQRPAEKKDRKLDIYRKERHRTLSRLFHQLRFLEVPYCNLIAGPDFAYNQNLQRVQEHWRIQWTEETEARLIECSHLGDSLNQASLNKLLATLHDEHTPGHEKVALLIHALSMGLHDVYTPIVDLITCWIQDETEVLPLCYGLNHLVVAYSVRTALAAQDLQELRSLLVSCFERVCVRLPWVKCISEDDVEALCEALISMHGLIAVETEWCDCSVFYEALTSVINENISLKIIGVCAGALLVAGVYNITQLKLIFDRVFGLSFIAPNQLGDFLWGFLAIARGLFINETSIQDMVTAVIQELDEETFLHALPLLRLAFAHLSLREKRMLADNLARENNAQVFNENIGWSQTTLAASIQLRPQVQMALRLWGLE